MAIEQALADHGGNRKDAAAALGIGLRTLYDKLRRYGEESGSGAPPDE
jgi:two-component system response regulator FlrC